MHSYFKPPTVVHLVCLDFVILWAILKYFIKKIFLSTEVIAYIWNYEILTHLICTLSFPLLKEGIVENLFKWAREADQPLRTYSTGLLGGAMENQDIAANYRDENSQLVRAVS